MTRRSRSTLKNFFRHGALPSANQFADFIDSTVNQVEDGFDKTAKEGIKISSRGECDSLISFFRESAFREDYADQPVWTISYDGKEDKLLFKKVGQAEDAPPVLSLSPKGKVGINRKDPEYALDVSGTVSSAGRIGIPTKNKRVPADGKWHDITEPITGCNAFEVMAGVGKKNSGKYALIHAIAMNAYNPGILSNLFKRKNRIKSQHAYYSDRGDRLDLRWETVSNNDRAYKLRLRSRCSYYDDKGQEKDEVYVSYYITRLWFDPVMERCLASARSNERSGGSDA